MTSLLRAGQEIYEHLVFYAALLCFGVLGVLYTALSALLYPLLPRRAASWLGRRTIGLLFRGYLALLRGCGILKLELSALDALRDEPGLIIAPNHPSLIDAMLVISRLPAVACIMKADIWDSPVLGGGARLAGYIRNDAPTGMVKRAIGELDAGRQLLLFPEGTRTRGGPVGRFKGGFALIARKSATTVQTVFIETNSAYLGKGWPLLKKPPMPLVYRVRLGRRFRAGADIGSFVRELERYYRNELAAAPDAGRSSQTRAEPRTRAA